MKLLRGRTRMGAVYAEKISDGHIEGKLARRKITLRRRNLRNHVARERKARCEKNQQHFIFYGNVTSNHKKKEKKNSPITTYLGKHVKDMETH